MIRVLLVSAACLLLAIETQAAEPISGGLEYQPASPPAPPDAATLIFKMFALTAATIIICGGVVWLLKRFEKRGLAGIGANGLLIHEGSLPLDRRSNLHIVKAEGHTLAVTTDHSGLRGIVLLSEPFEHALEVETARTNRMTFQSHFQR